VCFFPKPSLQHDFWPTIPDEHWTQIPRAFRKWNSTNSWCQQRTNTDHQPHGLILVKVHKAASSTLAGVNLRIAHHVGSRIRRNQKPCCSFQSHNDSRVYRNRDPSRSFLYASIRHPAHRALSWIFYTLSNREQKITEEVVLKMLKSRYYFITGQSGHPEMRPINESGAQVGYMNIDDHTQFPIWKEHQPNRVQNLSLAISRVEQVMQQFDLIIIVERMHESLVVLQLLLGLETTDILYLSAKTNGGVSRTWKPNPGCHRIQKTLMHPRVQNFLNSRTFFAQNYQDFILYKAANKSLDMTIEVLGRARFDAALSKYQKMMEEAKTCEEEAIFPCDSEGRFHNVTNCYQKDWGCGYPCLDRRFGI